MRCRFLLVTLFVCFISCKCNRSYLEVIDSCKITSIIELKNLKQKTDCYTIKGTIFHKYECYCPKGVICKPCHSMSHMHISMNKNDEDLTLSKNDIIIFTNRNNNFKTNTTYNFSVSVEELIHKINDTTTKKSYQYNLLGYSEIK